MVFMPHWPQLLGNKPIDLGLERILALLDTLGNPHRKLPPVIHIAGTNGKGSTSAFLRSIFRAAGYRTHCYTSPHLLNFNERIVINGNPIDDYDLYQIMEECRIASQTHSIPVTFFEGTTAGAFLAFSRHDADVVILETGLGGRLDATNVIEQPLATILTSISMDHTEYLGDHIDLIAREKAGIMKRGSVCISSLQVDSVDVVLQQQAQTVECPLLSFGYDWHSEPNDQGMLYHDASRNTSFHYPLPSLIGDHQIINAGNAICAIKHLTEFNITDEAIAKGLTTTSWPARLERITKGKLMERLPKGQGWELWLDGAHNEAAAHILQHALSNLPAKPLYLAVGMTRGRNVELFLKHFKDKAQLVAGVLVETEPSAYKSEYIAKQAEAMGFHAIESESIEHAIDRLIAEGKTPGRIVFTGSLYLASDVYKANQA